VAQFQGDLAVAAAPQRFELGTTRALAVRNVWPDLMKAAIWVDYRDIPGRWWTTEVPVRLEIADDSSS